MIGKVGNTEVDFVAEKNGVYSYIQVTADMTAKETFERELKPLSNIRDNYEKIVHTGKIPSRLAAWERFINKKSLGFKFQDSFIPFFHKLNPFVCHRRKPTTFRWWEEPC